jgi:hypothetical protein
MGTRRLEEAVRRACRDMPPSLVMRTSLIPLPRRDRKPHPAMGLYSRTVSVKSAVTPTLLQRRIDKAAAIASHNGGLLKALIHLDQPFRALVCPAHRETAAPRHPPELTAIGCHALRLWRRFRRDVPRLPRGSRGILPPDPARDRRASTPSDIEPRATLPNRPVKPTPAARGVGEIAPHGRWYPRRVRCSRR